jgi:hypothetical protein
LAEVRIKLHQFLQTLAIGFERASLQYATEARDVLEFAVQILGYGQSALSALHYVSISS